MCKNAVCISSALIAAKYAAACCSSLGPSLFGGNFILFKKIHFIDYVVTVVLIFPPVPSSTQYPHSLQQPPTLSSCPWVVHISSLASPFPILFLTSTLCIWYRPLMLLLSCTFSPILPPPTETPPCDLCIYDSVPVLLVCSVCYLDSVIDRCEFVTTLVFIILIFILHNSL